MFTRFFVFILALLLFTVSGTPRVNATEPAPLGQSKKENSEEQALAIRGQDALKKRNWLQAEELYRQLLAEHPAAWQYHKGLGDAQLSLGKYDDALISYGKGVELASAAPSAVGDSDEMKARNAAVGQMLVGKAKAYLKLRKNDEAFQYFTNAAGISPNPAESYFNLCANCYKTGDMKHALQACEKAIETDPGKADAYFIKGSVLFSNSSLDKNRRLVLPAGTTEALKKYLELAPEGGYSYDVKHMLEEAGIK